MPGSSACFTTEELELVGRLTEMGFTRDEVLMALIKGRWQLDAALAVLIEADAEDPVPSTNEKPSEAYGGAASVPLCSFGCGRPARLVSCCRSCRSAQGPHAQVCNHGVASRVRPVPSPGETSKGTAPDVEPFPAGTKPCCSGVATGTRSAACAAAPPVNPRPGRDRLGYLLLDCGDSSLRGWHPASWDELERRLGITQGALAGHLQQFGVQVRNCTSREQAARIWGAWYRGVPLPDH